MDHNVNILIKYIYIKYNTTAPKECENKCYGASFVIV